ncbi:hypothetical protein [Cellulomonas sp. C5510]|uniref:hypothetical protein n=1 Tax=Cellulomonas sp. C5510 TaxID=2871170 RepID=UPI001C96FFBA|nr:hypothetical protein [Cellulomonas sp. C5510]QZN85707.1 hypothetical protein K5O09_00210 [Cellulomonas sp. C5510]
MLLDEPTPRAGVPRDALPPVGDEQDDVIGQARRRAELVRDHVEQALALAEQQGGPFDFLSLASAAHCSVAYLRQHREFATRIRALQATVPQDPEDERCRALRGRLVRAERRAAALQAAVTRLEEENARLRDRLAAQVRSVPVARLGPGIRRPGAPLR